MPENDDCEHAFRLGERPVTCVNCGYSPGHNLLDIAAAEMQKTREALSAQRAATPRNRAERRAARLRKNLHVHVVTR